MNKRSLVWMAVWDCLLLLLLGVLLRGHEITIIAGLVAIGLVGALLLKLFSFVVFEETEQFQKVSGLSILIETVAVLGIFHVLVTLGVYEGKLVYYAIAGLAALTMIGLGYQVVRGNIKSIQ